MAHELWGDPRILQGPQVHWEQHNLWTVSRQQEEWLRLHPFRVRVGSYRSVWKTQQGVHRLEICEPLPHYLRWLSQLQCRRVSNQFFNKLNYFQTQQILIEFIYVLETMAELRSEEEETEDLVVVVVVAVNKTLTSVRRSTMTTRPRWSSYVVAPGRSPIKK